MLDRALKYILSALQVQLLLMGDIIHLLLATVHHLRISERSGLSGLIGFVQMLLRDTSQECLKDIPLWDGSRKAPARADA